MWIKKTMLPSNTWLTCCVWGVCEKRLLPELVIIDGCLDSGFNRDDAWGFRALEPSRSCISSIALVLLKTGINHPTSKLHLGPHFTSPYLVVVIRTGGTSECRLRANGYGAKTVAFLEKTSCECSYVIQSTSIVAHSRCSGNAGGTVRRSKSRHRVHLNRQLKWSCGHAESGP